MSSLLKVRCLLLFTVVAPVVQSSEHGKVVEAAEMMKEAIGELEETLQKTSKDLGFITHMIERVQDGIAMVSQCFRANKVVTPPQYPPPPCPHLRLPTPRLLQELSSAPTTIP